MVPSAKIQPFKPYLPLVSDRWMVSQRYDLFFSLEAVFLPCFFGGFIKLQVSSISSFRATQF